MLYWYPRLNRSLVAAVCPALLVVSFSANAGPLAVTHTPLYTFHGDDSNDRFGFSVSGAGDVDADGFDDLIVGAPRDDNNGSSSGSARVFSGRTGAILYHFDGDNKSDSLGFSVSGAGDVNRDGYSDLIIGAYKDDNNGKDDSGSARVISGFNGSTLYQFNGVAADDRFGQSVSAAGDVNGDSYADLVVGAELASRNGPQSGSASVFSGFNGTLLQTFNGNSSGDQLGSAVSGAGDFNGDGYDDIIVGASKANGRGSVSVFSGIDGSTLLSLNGDSSGDLYGYSVSGAGDINGDGQRDLIVGSLGDDTNGSGSGGAQVSSGFDGASLYQFQGDAAGDALGTSVSGVGDVNGDGFDDIIIGVPFDDTGGADRGSARVISGANGETLYTFSGDNASDGFGISVSGAGDVNGDGLADFIVGSTTGGNNGGGYARVFVSQVAIPEPGAACLLAVGVGILTTRRQRRI